MSSAVLDRLLSEDQDKDLLRFITCGSVDDGNSTLIGRLLHDSKSVFEDQLMDIKSDSRKLGVVDGDIDLSLLVDGLQSEREQGITIDVAYRYFSTKKRKFIIADTPGHEQYTRNMATGASTADLTIILVDARHGIKTQTRRHSYIVSLLGIKNVIVAVNKMDAVSYSADRFFTISEDYREVSKLLNFESVFFVPISALKGDNIVSNSSNMDWYKGLPILGLLESVEIIKKEDLGLRFPIQYVNRLSNGKRLYCGTVANGNIFLNEQVTILPSSIKTSISSIACGSKLLNNALCGESISVSVSNDIDIGRGDILVSSKQDYLTGDRLKAVVVCMDEMGLQKNIEYIAKYTTQYLPIKILEFTHKVDVSSFNKNATENLSFNDVGECIFEFPKKIIFDLYRDCKTTGSFILIDKFSNKTIALCMISSNIENSGAYKRVGYVEKFLNRLARKFYPHWDAKDISCL